MPLATTSNFAEIVDPKIIDSLELYTGAIPAEYGGDRMGGVVNIITNRPTDVPEGIYGTLSGGVGNQAQGIGQLDTSARFGRARLFFDANTQSDRLAVWTRRPSMRFTTTRRRAISFSASSRS